MDRNFRVLFLAALTAVCINLFGVKGADAMTMDDYLNLSGKERADVRRAYCRGGDLGDECSAEEVKAISVKRVGTTGNSDEIAKLQAKLVKLNVEILKVKGGETSSAGEELVDERDRLNREIEVLRTPRVELADPTMFESAVPPAPESEESSSEASNDPPFLAYFPGADTCNDDVDCPVKGSACIEQVCFPGWGKAKAIGSRKGWIDGAKAIVASELNPTATSTFDGGTQLCSLRPLQPGCSKTCEDDEFAAVLGTADAFPPDMQRHIDLIRVANSCHKKDDGMTCQNPEWGYLANTNTVNYGQVRCLKRSSLPEPVVSQVNRAVGQAVAALPPPPVSTAQQNNSAKQDESDLSVTLGGNVGYHSSLRSTFYNNGYAALLIEPTWLFDRLALRFTMSGGYGGRDQFSTLYHLTGGPLVGYRINEWFDFGGGVLASGLYGYTPIDTDDDGKGEGSYLMQYQVDGTVYAAFLLGDWLELKPYFGVGYGVNQVFPDHNVSFGGGLMFGIPIGRDDEKK